jgi:hypothetical protein
VKDPGNFGFALLDADLGDFIFAKCVAETSNINFLEKQYYLPKLTLTLTLSATWQWLINSRNLVLSGYNLTHYLYCEGELIDQGQADLTITSFEDQ